WYPHRENTRESAPDLLVAKVAQKVMDEAREKFGTEMEIKEFFGGICDLSYMGYKGSAFDPFCIAANMPGWGSIYRVAVKDLMKLDIPVLNIGPSGKDPHKPTERLYLPFSLEVFPALLEKAVKSFKE
ncbi:MAG TPA: peptidase M20, partial [Thermovirga lienii]|nr:peptidase M20 [Thermovirga lienii]